MPKAETAALPRPEQIASGTNRRIIAPGRPDAPTRPGVVPERRRAPIKAPTNPGTKPEVAPVEAPTTPRTDDKPRQA